MIKILFVCHGNICRSTMAQYVFQDLVNKAGLEDQFYINSAGTSREELGNGVHYGTRNKLNEMGIFCGDHQAIQMTKEDYDTYDYLIGMEQVNFRNMKRIAGGDQDGKMHLLLSFAGSKRDIADPWYTGNFNETYRDVEEGCRSLLEMLSNNQ